MAYTYDDFKKAAQDAGLLDKFSTDDLDLAQRNPDAGMSILGYKKDFGAATTDDQRALANAGANNVRQKYGYATGGTTISMATPAKSTGYISPYKSQIDSALGRVQNSSFSYDPDSDTSYQSYKKAYTREGERATSDALGEAAAATGGIPSSYATTAAAQAGQYYASKLADKVPELEQQAYNNYLQEKNIDLQILDALSGLDSTDYNKYSADRSFNYTKDLNDQQTKQTNTENEAALLASAGDFSYYKKLFPDMTDAQINQLVAAYNQKNTKTSGTASTYSYPTENNPNSGTPTGSLDNATVSTLRNAMQSAIDSNKTTLKELQEAATKDLNDGNIDETAYRHTLAAIYQIGGSARRRTN